MKCPIERMVPPKACWQGPVLRHLAVFTAFGKGFRA
jgi:hypothetical protein